MNKHERKAMIEFTKAISRLSNICENLVKHALPEHMREKGMEEIAFVEGHLEAIVTQMELAWKDPYEES